MGQEHQDSPQVGRPEGQYANYFEVGYNALEFLFDFGQCYPESTEARFHTRIITGPVYAKALLKVFQESIDQYERTFGAIPEEDK